MSDRDTVAEPVLADPVLAPVPYAAKVASAGVAAAGVLFAAFWLAQPGMGALPPHVPTSRAELAASIITPIDADDRGAVDAAVSLLNVAEPLRRQIEQDVLADRRHLGWIVVQDSMDPDGDVIAIESGGIVQQIVLEKAWIPVPVLRDSNRVGITAIKDGQGGGITLALVTAGGQMALRIMLPGEHIEVAAQ